MRYVRSLVLSTNQKFKHPMIKTELMQFNTNRKKLVAKRDDINRSATYPMSKDMNNLETVIKCCVKENSLL